MRFADALVLVISLPHDVDRRSLHSGVFHHIS